MNFIIVTLILLQATLTTTQVIAKDKTSNKFSESEVIKEFAQFDTNHVDNHLTVFKVYGSIEVRGYEGDEIEINAKNEVFANTQKLVEEGLEEIGLKIEKHGQKIYAYLDSPYTYFNQEEEKIWHSDTCWRHDDCSKKHVKRKAYKYHMDITVNVPRHTNIKISTINNGDITVTGISAKSIEVNNINGAIDMIDVSGKTEVNAINKDINVAYSKNPVDDSQFHSINGDITINFAGIPDAEVVYQTMHGDLYTSFDVSVMEPKVKHTSKKKEHGIKYKLNAENRLLVGNGGPEYRFQSLNGDIKFK